MAVPNTISVHGPTPYRRTVVSFDTLDTSVTESPFWLHRGRNDIRPTAKSNVERLSSGCWVLSPINASFAAGHETTTGQSAVMRLSEWSHDTRVVESPFQRAYSELSGVTTGASADLSASGDYFFERRVGAGINWAADYTIYFSPPQLSYTNPIIQMDRVMDGPLIGHHDADTGYLLKISLPGDTASVPDNILTFYFGGTLCNEATCPHQGYGLFALALSGDGFAVLYERIDNSWQQQARWKYTVPAFLGQTVAIRILPHAPGYIEFRAYLGDETPHNLISILDKAAIAASEKAKGEGVQTYTHKITNRGAIPGTSTTVPTSVVTGPGRVAFDVRRDLRVLWQLSRLIYPASGSLTDGVFAVPASNGSSHILQVVREGYDYSADGVTFLTNITAQAQDTGGSNLTPGTEFITLFGQSKLQSGWILPGGENAAQVTWTFTNTESGTRYHTPSLVGYSAYKNLTITDINPGEKTGGTLREISIMGPDWQPDQESAHLTISDLLNEIVILGTRGQIPLKIEQEYDVTGNRSILFEGYTGRVEAVKRITASGTGYPSKSWQDYHIQCMGKWIRLKERFFFNRVPFSRSGQSPSGAAYEAGNELPWKVTDIIKVVLNQNGFYDTQIDVFDDPTRLFSSIFTTADEAYQAAPGTAVDEFLIRLASDFLNAALIWDANAGARGMWRLRRPPEGTEEVLWHFVTAPQASVRPTLPHLSAAYPSKTSPILGPNAFTTYTVPPEGNVLTVTGRSPEDTSSKGITKVQRTLVNPASYNATGYGPADPENLDYLGRAVQIEYSDPTLTGSTAAQAQAAVDFVARRIFNVACRGQKFAKFTAELVLCSPGDPVYTTHLRRPLMVGDLVTIDEVLWVIRSVSPVYHKDHISTAEYECMLFRPEVEFGWR